MFSIRRFYTSFLRSKLPLKISNPLILSQKRFKNTDKPLIKFKKEKRSKNIRKPYKLKNNKGAVARFIVVQNGYKRMLCGKSHFRRKLRSRKDMKKRILVNKQQKRHLNKLIPYFKKKYLK